MLVSFNEKSLKRKGRKVNARKLIFWPENIEMVFYKGKYYKVFLNKKVFIRYFPTK